MVIRVILIVTTAFALHLPQLVRENQHYDLFIYRAGAQIALDGFSPYDSTELKRRVIEQYPDEPLLHQNCGFFLAPQAVVLFLPFALLPWGFAKVVWSILCFVLLGWAILRLPNWTQDERSRTYLWIAAILIAFNPTLLLLMKPAQTTVIAFAMMIVTRRPEIWALAFIKPHIMLPLIVLANVAHGWRGVVRIAVAICVLNLVGLALTPDRFQTAIQYVHHLADGHKLVLFNRVELNPQITSWNRLVFALGGPTWNLGIGLTIVGYAVWFAAVSVCVRNSPTSVAWWLAVVGVGSVLCCQVLGYESFLMMVLWPLVWEWFQHSRRIASVLMCELLISYLPFVPLGETAPFAELLMSLRAVSVASVALTLLVVGPPTCHR